MLKAGEEDSDFASFMSRLQIKQQLRKEERLSREARETRENNSLESKVAIDEKPVVATIAVEKRSKLDDLMAGLSTLVKGGEVEKKDDDFEDF